MLWKKLTRIYVTGVNRRRTTTGAGAPKSCVKLNFGGGPARRVPRGTSPWKVGTIFVWKPGPG